jgi:hypothetical protein
MPIVGLFKTLHVMLFALALAFASSVRNLQIITQSHLTSPPLATPNYEIQFLSKRWRAERNMWLSAFAFTMWAVLAAFYRELGRRLQAEERVCEIEMSMDGYTVDTTREVTSRNVDLMSPRSVGIPSPVKSRPRGASTTPPPAATATAAAKKAGENVSGAATVAPGAEGAAASSGAPREVELTSDKFTKKDQ